MERRSEIHFAQNETNFMLENDPELKNLRETFLNGTGINFDFMLDPEGRAVLVEIERTESFEDSDLDDPAYTRHNHLLGC